MSQTVTGRVQRGIHTRDGERIWIIAWDDGETRKMIDLEDPTPEFRPGDRVVLAGATLRLVDQQARA